MRLGHAMFGSGISGFTLLGTDLAAAGYAFLKLGADFFASSPFEGIAATAEHEQGADRE